MLNIQYMIGLTVPTVHLQCHVTTFKNNYIFLPLSNGCVNVKYFLNLL